jgi:hypothetical protein
VSGQLDALTTFTSGERAPGTHWKGGWVGPRARLNDMEEKKFLTLLELELPFFSQPACSQLLYWLHYPGTFISSRLMLICIWLIHTGFSHNKCPETFVSGFLQPSENLFSLIHGSTACWKDVLPVQHAIERWVVFVQMGQKAEFLSVASRKNNPRAVAWTARGCVWKKVDCGQLYVCVDICKWCQLHKNATN